MKLTHTAFTIFSAAFLASATAAPHTSHDTTVQLTVWNMLSKPVVMKCTPSQQDIMVAPTEIEIAANDSPPILINTPHGGNLITCTIANASFTYTLIGSNHEQVSITPLDAGQPNFYYNPSYPGALTYK
ncbi:MAG: hypothetical protein QM752_03740 [Gammaproteobacteria bacterium]